MDEYDCACCGDTVEANEANWPTFGMFEGVPLCNDCYTEFYALKAQTKNEQ